MTKQPTLTSNWCPKCWSEKQYNKHSGIQYDCNGRYTDIEFEYCTNLDCEYVDVYIF